MKNEFKISCYTLWRFFNMRIPSIFQICLRPWLVRTNFHVFLDFILHCFI